MLTFIFYNYFIFEMIEDFEKIAFSRNIIEDYKSVSFKIIIKS